MSLTDDDTTVPLFDDPQEEAKPKRGRPKGSRTTGTTRAPSGLRDELKQAHLGLSMVLVGATNPALLGQTWAIDILDEQSAKWADAALAVARQDERVMNTLKWAMQSGVWLGLLTATAGSVLTVATMSGKVAVPVGPVMFLQPKLGQQMVASMQAEAAARAASMPSTNGNGDGGAEIP